jgi:hypothetical protein
MELALAALPGVITSCLLVWVLSTVLSRQSVERKAHRDDIARLVTANRDEVAGLTASYSADLAATHATHREQLDSLVDKHRREVADLCQRIQAPQIAVAEHAGQNTTDLPSVDIADDKALQAIAERERNLDRMWGELHSRAEELAAEN